MLAEDERAARREEQRAAPRQKIDVEVTIASESHFFAGLAGDVSVGGVFVATYARIPVGRELSIAFSLPDGEVMARGIVRWRREGSDRVAPGIGVQFEMLDEADWKIIERFCEERPPILVDDDASSPSANEVDAG